MSELDAYETPPGYGDMIGKCLTFAEIEALLAAERERCAAVADKWASEVERDAELAAGFQPFETTFRCRARAIRRVAELIRNLPSQTEGGQP